MSDNKFRVGQRVVCVMSGGNLDPARLRAILQAGSSIADL